MIAGTKGDVEKTKEFVIIVGKTDVERVADDKTALSLSSLDIYTAGNMNLPLTGDNGSTITWNSDKDSVISDAGMVVLPSSIEEVVLTATISFNGTNDTKEFVVTVHPLVQYTVTFTSYNGTTIPDQTVNGGSTVTEPEYATGIFARR